jgi:hypothetical protein
MSFDNKAKPTLCEREKEIAVQLPADSNIEPSLTDADSQDGTTEPEVVEAQPPYSSFTNGQKIAITLTVSFLALISPLSGQIYLPALEALAESLNVPVSYINLTITTFMV